MQGRLEAAQMVALVGLAALFVETQLDEQLHTQQCDCKVLPCVFTLDLLHSST